MGASVGKGPAMTFYEPFAVEPFTEAQLWDRLADCVLDHFPSPDCDLVREWIAVQRMKSELLASRGVPDSVIRNGTPFPWGDAVVIPDPPASGADHGS